MRLGDRHGIGELPAHALHEDIGGDQFRNAEDPERLILILLIERLPGVGVDHVDGGCRHRGRSWPEISATAAIAPARSAKREAKPLFSPRSDGRPQIIADLSVTSPVF
jgi:hypothetical protein